jgi:hypothetical protein
MGVPIYLSGAVRPDLNCAGFGFMRTSFIGNRFPLGATWAADTGCFTQPKAFTVDRYLAWLRSHQSAQASCLFATAQDSVGNAALTLALSLPMLPAIRDLGYRAAFVGQDGIEWTQLPWNAFDAFFIGGSTEWKLGPIARAYAFEAKARGKWLHMGRVNSLKRWRYAQSLGCDSVDGTYVAFGGDRNVARLKKWSALLRSQLTLEQLTGIEVN